MTSLRMRVVEALSPFACHPEHADVAFDVVLGYLAENAGEWCRKAWVGESAATISTVDDLHAREDR